MQQEPTLLAPAAEPVTLTPVTVATPASDTPPPWKLRDGLFLLGGLVAVSLGMRALLELAAHVTPTAVVTVQIIADVLVVFAAVWIVRARGGDAKRWLLGRDSWLIEAALGVAFVIPLLCLGAAVSLTMRFLFGPPEIGQRVAMLTGQLSLAGRLAMAAMGVVLAPVAEEMLFRGLLLSSLRARIGWCLAWLIQAALFAVVHRESLQVTLALFAVGLGLGGIYLWRRSVLATSLMHAGFNSVPMAWLVALVWINQHTPAATWEEAQRPPSWWSSPWVEQYARTIPDEPTAQRQWDAARNFGSRGPQLWKLEARAFQKVIDRFPDDAEYSAKSLAGIQEIYLLFLHDPRRAVVAGRTLLERYSGEREMCARAMLSNAQAHLELDELDAAAALVDEAAERFADLRDVQQRIKGIRDELLRRRGP